MPLPCHGLIPETVSPHLVFPFRCRCPTRRSHDIPCELLRTDAYSKYLSQPPTEEQLNFRARVREALAAMTDDASVAFKILSEDTGVITRERFPDIISDIVHAGVNDAVHQLQEGFDDGDSELLEVLFASLLDNVDDIPVHFPMVSERIFSALDTSGDQKITLEEFQQFVGLLKGSPDLIFAIFAGSNRTAVISVANSKPVLMEITGAWPCGGIWACCCSSVCHRSQRALLCCFPHVHDIYRVCGV